MCSYIRPGGLRYTAVLFGQKGSMMHLGNGLWGVLVLAADVWAIINILQSSESNGTKLLWVLGVLLLPVLGVIGWYFLGPRDRRV